MSSPLILSIDLGSSSVKVAVVDVTGAISGTGIRALRTLQPSPGVAEQDPRQLWHAVCDASGDALRACGRPASEVAAVSCTSQYFSLIPVDSAGAPLANLMMWMDERGAPFGQALYSDHPDAIGTWLERTGFLPVPSGSDSVSHALYFKHRQAEIYERAHKLVEPADYLAGLLTGHWVTNACTGFAQLLIDNRDLENPAYDDELIGIAGIDRDKLPDIVEVGANLGTLTKSAAADLGLEATTQVWAGVNDTQAVSIGTGTHLPGRAGINIGTTCQVLGFLDSLRTDPWNNVFAMPSALPGRYNVMAENGLGARLLEHFLTDLVFPRDALHDRGPENPYTGVDAALADATPGCDGLLYLPWLGGSNTPRPNSLMRGGFLNMSLATNRASMLRAVVEGVTFNLYWQLGYAETLVGHPIEELRFAGGGAQYDQWAQAVADIMRRPVLQMADPRHTNNRATAFLGFEKMGAISLDATDGFFPIRNRYEPRPEHRAMYDHHFGQFQAAYEQTQPIFEALNQPPSAARKPE